MKQIQQIQTTPINEKQIKQLQDYVKKRYKEAGMDYQTYDGTAKLDTDVSFEENFNAFQEELNKILPPAKPTKDEIKEIKRKEEEEREKERIEEEKEIKVREEAEAERIKNLPNSREEEKIFFDMDSIIQQTISSKKARGCLIFGGSSLGKTFRVRKSMLKNQVPYVLHCGHITEMKFYIKCFQNADKIHIFDDESILHSKTFLNMIKAMLNGETGLVEYDTTRKFPSGVNSSFTFTGKVIIILNDLPRNDEHFKAVKNRVLNYELILNRQQRLNLLYERAKNEKIEGTTKEERIMIVDWIKDNTDNSTLNLNYRLYEKTIDFYIHQNNDWKRLTKTQIEGIDKYTMLIIQGVDNISDWCQKTGKTPRTYYRYKQKAKKLEGEYEYG
jgi:predicted HicB family RNase H-like nuclease